MDKDIRIKQYFQSEESFENIKKLYKQLHGRKNIELKIFLKELLYLSVEKQKDEETRRFWQTPDEFFKVCTKSMLEYLFLDATSNRKRNCTMFGKQVNKYLGYLL